MIPNIDPAQLYPLKGQIPAQSIAAAGNATTGATYLQIPPGSRWIRVDLSCGALGGGSEQVDILQATAAAGTGSKALVTNAITNAVNNTTSTYTGALPALSDINNGFDFVQVKITNTGGTGALVSAVVSFGPAAFAG